MSLHLILTSDLRRAAETTAELLKEVQVPMQYAPAWREMNNGDLAGLPNALAEERYPGHYFSSLAMDEPYPGGESPRQVFERISRAFEALCQKMITHQLPENVAVVTHGGVISIVYHLLKGLSCERPILEQHTSFLSNCGDGHSRDFVPGWSVENYPRE
jgi:probable phosphoglycerate mutase